MLPLTIGLWVVSLGLLPMLAAGQDKDQFRDEAKALESQLRGFGEPRDRCSLGAYIVDGAVVARTSNTATLRPGDRLLIINNVNVTDKRADDVIALLRELAPTAVVLITLDRQRQIIDVEVSCSNSRPTMEPLVNALGYASRGKFDDCLEAVNQLSTSHVDTAGAMLKAQCAAVSRNAKKLDVPSLMAQAFAMAIEDARWAPMSRRLELVNQLRSVEGLITQGLGPARFQSLVAATRAWPGGEKLFDESTPDWALFRRNSEAALRARLIDPESAKIEWHYGFLLGWWRPLFSKRIEGYWTCGTINARNRMGGYTGRTSFVVVLNSSGNVNFVDIGESEDFDLVSSACSNSVKLLPPPPAQLLAASSLPAAPVLSVADELKKLVDLKNSGALTESEFQAAKQRLLGTPRP